MKVNDFLQKLEMCTRIKTLYVMGGFGIPLNGAGKTRMKNQYAYNARSERAAKIDAASSDTFAFDCCGLVKGILWGFIGDKSLQYGGAVYRSNGVPDMDQSGLWQLCTDRSTNMSIILAGEYLHMSGHCGIYVGNGQVIECTPKWNDCVQKTNLTDREWEGHGKLPWVEYDSENSTDYLTVLNDYLSEIIDIVNRCKTELMGLKVR